MNAHPWITEHAAEIVRLRAVERLTIVEIIQRLGAVVTPARIALVQDHCLHHFGKRDYRGIDAGPMPGKSPTGRHNPAP
jgi:hypothetical protein